jgi:hypothetical protein
MGHNAGVVRSDVIPSAIGNDFRANNVNAGSITQVDRHWIIDIRYSCSTGLKAMVVAAANLFHVKGGFKISCDICSIHLQKVIVHPVRPIDPVEGRLCQRWKKALKITVITFVKDLLPACQSCPQTTHYARMLGCHIHSMELIA